MGGRAVKGCGKIHRNEIRPTLDNVSNILGIPGLADRTIGSAYKKEFSGDIDVVLSPVIPEIKEALRNKLISVFGPTQVLNVGNGYSVPARIIDYDESAVAIPRTGLVQLDITFGDLEWEKFYHFSPGDESEYKGVHRNMAMNAICSLKDLSYPDKFDTYDRPVECIRWKFSIEGLVKVIRRSVFSEQTQKYNRKQVDEIIQGPYTDHDEIARLIFDNGYAHALDLESLETIIDGVKAYMPGHVHEPVFDKIALYLSEWREGVLAKVPPDIEPYYAKYDK